MPNKKLLLANGIYQCTYLYNKSVMILVPHQDDELIIAGTILPILRSNKCEISVVYSTNGDYEGKNKGRRRLKEALAYCKNQGISEQNIYFMGFGDQGEKGVHLYNSAGLIKSPAGQKQTYALDCHESVAKLYLGNEVEYSRENYICLLKSILKCILPDIIFCIDCDIHSDHIALSLMFEEILSELIREMQYMPIVFKAFAHDMLWMGVKDRCGINLKGCIPIEENPNHTYAVQFQKSYYAWEDRVRFPVFSQYITRGIYSNRFRKTMSLYRSQHVKYHFNRLLNSDQLFWERKTDNLVYHAKIKVSSGNPENFYTMKMFDCENLMLKTNILESSGLFWKPDALDEMKMATFDFTNVIEVGSINIYTGFDEYLTANLRIVFDDQLQINLANLKGYGQRNEVRFNVPILCKRVRLQLFDDVTKIVKLEVLPYMEEELYYAKIMIDNEFIYRYYRSYFEKEPMIQIYEYGNRGSRVIDEANIDKTYLISIIENEKEVFIKNIKEIFSKNRRVVRICVKNKKNRSIIDEIELHYCSGCFKKFIMLWDRFYSIINDVLYKMVRMLHL